MSRSSPATPQSAPGLDNLPNWARLLAPHATEWRVRKRGGDGPRVLIATTVGGGTSAAMSAFESFLAVPLHFSIEFLGFLIAVGGALLALARHLRFVARPNEALIFSGKKYVESDGTIRRIESATKVWSAGVAASPLGKDLAAHAQLAGTSTGHHTLGS